VSSAVVILTPSCIGISSQHGLQLLALQFSFMQYHGKLSTPLSYTSHILSAGCQPKHEVNRWIVDCWEPSQVGSQQEESDAGQALPLVLLQADRQQCKHRAGASAQAVD